MWKFLKPRWPYIIGGFATLFLLIETKSLFAYCVISVILWSYDIDDRRRAKDNGEKLPNYSMLGNSDAAAQQHRNGLKLIALGFFVAGLAHQIYLNLPLNR